MTTWKRVSSKIIFSHPRIKLAEDIVILPNGNKVKYIRYEGYSDVSTIMTMGRDNKFLMIREYTYPIDQELLKFPEGAIDKNEDPKVAAKRELEEETGFSAAKFVIIGSNLHFHRRSKAKNYIVVASSPYELAEKPPGDQEENITTVWLTEKEIWAAIKNGQIIQKNALAAWAHYQANK